MLQSALFAILEAPRQPLDTLCRVFGFLFAHGREAHGVLQDGQEQCPGGVGRLTPDLGPPRIHTL